MKNSLVVTIIIIVSLCSICASYEYNECYFCDSGIDVECATKPFKKKMIQCVNRCAIGILNGTAITVRGCAEDIEGKSVVFQSCSGRLCNNETFPNSRPFCHQCFGKGCLADPGEPLACGHYNPGGFCYVAIDETNDIYAAGCYNDPRKSVPKEIEAVCTGNGCNKGNDGRKNATCVNCSSTDNKDCWNITAIDDTNTCSYLTLSTQSAKCYTYETESGVVKGCVVNLDKDLSGEKGYHECNGYLCNKWFKKPEKELKCATCSSKENPNCLDSPKEAPLQKCRNPNDMCSWQVKQGILYQGCKIDFEDFTPQEGTGGSCEDSHCFEQDMLPNIVCFSCNSKDNEKCIGNPRDNHIFAEICSAKDDRCVSRIRENSVFRGCKSSSDVLGSDEGSSKECNSSKCNTDILEVGMRCYTCSSDIDSSCTAKPTANSIKVCVDPNDTCAWKIEDGVVYRGCRGSIGNFSAVQGASGECSGSLCNHEHIGNTRLGCYKCQGSECLMSPGRVQLCENHQAVDKCFVDVIDKTTVTRGCLSDKISCVGKFCYKCDGFGCNYQPGKRFFQCASCRSYDTNDCIRERMTVGSNATRRVIDTCLIDNEVYCHHEALLGHPQKCFTYHELDVVIRGCSKDMPKKIKGSKNVVECFGDNCNKDCIKRIKCAVCDSRTDAKCENDVDNLKLQECSPQFSSCYTCDDKNGTIIRGCGASFGNSAMKCDFCQGRNGCNRERKPLKCYNCDSRYDPNCAQWTREAELEECPHPDDECIWRIAGEYTMRGCSSKVRDCSFREGACESCREDKCNGGIKPDNRLQCHQCEGPACVEQIGTPIACEYYKPGDKCFTGIIDEHNVVRGCMSDKIDRCLSLNKCYVCSAVGCNSSPFAMSFFPRAVH